LEKLASTVAETEAESSIDEYLSLKCLRRRKQKLAFVRRRGGQKMNKKMVPTAFTVMLLFSTLAGVQFVRLADANFMPMQIPQPAFIIRSDGRVDPSTAPIQRDGNVYTFTNDIAG